MQVTLYRVPVSLTHKFNALLDLYLSNQTHSSDVNASHLSPNDRNFNSWNFNFWKNLMRYERENTTVDCHVSMNTSERDHILNKTTRIDRAIEIQYNNRIQEEVAYHTTKQTSVISRQRRSNITLLIVGVIEAGMAALTTAGIDIAAMINPNELAREVSTILKSKVFIQDSAINSKRASEIIAIWMNTSIQSIIARLETNSSTYDRILCDDDQSTESAELNYMLEFHKLTHDKLLRELSSQKPPLDICSDIARRVSNGNVSQEKYNLLACLSFGFAWAISYADGIVTVLVLHPLVDVFSTHTLRTQATSGSL